jgi:ABC-type oligopeptide transport system ATPase subunit
VNNTDSSPTLLVVDRLVKVYDRKRGVAAVDDVSFEVQRGRTVALVGESGSGKSTTARCVMRLVEPTSGTVTFDGVDVSSLDRKAMNRLRRRMQIIFQDPRASFDPRMRLEKSMLEPLKAFGLYDAEGRAARVAELLELVGLTSSHGRRYPSELSGGQLQRVAIARALAVEPDLIVCDEPVSALDVSIQAQIMTLLRELQERLGLTYLFISHDLAVVNEIAHDVMVMQNGQIIERGRVADVLDHPTVAYTRQLVDAALVPDPTAHNRDL